VFQASPCPKLEQFPPLRKAPRPGTRQSSHPASTKKKVAFASGIFHHAAIMKPPIVAGLVTAAVLITVAIEETRIAWMRAGIKTDNPN
jgi:hypothetical protein